MKRSTSKNPEKEAERDQMIINAHLVYLELATSLINKAKTTLASISSPDITVYVRMLEVEKYVADAERQIDQIRDRWVQAVRRLGNTCTKHLDFWTHHSTETAEAWTGEKGT